MVVLCTRIQVESELRRLDSVVDTIVFEIQTTFVGFVFQSFDFYLIYR